MKPLCIDLFCGLGGWTEGFLAEGYRVVGFDNERHRYPARAVPESDGTKTGGDWSAWEYQSSFFRESAHPERTAELQRIATVMARESGRQDHSEALRKARRNHRPIGEAVEHAWKSRRAAYLAAAGRSEIA